LIMSHLFEVTGLLGWCFQLFVFDHLAFLSRIKSMG